MRYLLFTALTALVAVMTLNLAFAQQPHQSPARADVDPAYAPFYHGVASGDPLADRVILWTRITTASPTATVRWQVATDTLFTNIVLTGTATTDSSRDYTVKVDAIGLQPNQWYYYRFRNDSVYSVVGRTRTAPNTAVANLRFAVLSCANYQDGFFNAYRDIARQNDVDAVVHLGDYIYEYGIDDFSPGVDTSRLHEPRREILNLNEYRARHSQYKLDPDLREVHRQYPFITIWDDHETANDSWKGGAANHTPATEGPWDARKTAGRRVYFEWMPIRDVYQSADTIHRVINWGGLAEFILLDTRLEGREEQIGVSGAPVTDTNRTLLGDRQLQWFKQKLTASGARWKLIGNQVMISPLRFLGTPLNQDQWDGYPAERTKVLRHIENGNIDNVVFLTGDIHSSWANDVPRDISRYTASTGAGSTAVEFVCTSVSSSSLIGAAVPVALIYTSNPNIKFAELSKRGYLLLDLTNARCQADWVHLSTVNNQTFTRSIAASWKSDNTANRLTRANNALPIRPNRPAPAPKLIITSLRNQTVTLTTLLCAPNPFADNISLQYYIPKASRVTIDLIHTNGTKVRTFTLPPQNAGLHEIDVPTNGLTPGLYSVILSNGNSVVTRRIVKR